jgi:hypothetical protein
MKPSEYIDHILKRHPMAKKATPWDDERIAAEVDDHLAEADAEDRERARRLLRQCRDESQRRIAELELDKEILQSHLAKYMRHSAWASQQQDKQDLVIQQLKRQSSLSTPQSFALEDFAEAAIWLTTKVDTLQGCITELEAKVADADTARRTLIVAGYGDSEDSLLDLVRVAVEMGQKQAQEGQSA